MSISETTGNPRKALTLHGTKIDLRMESPYSTPVNYKTFPDINHLFEQSKFDQIIATYLPLARQEELVDSEILIVLVQALIRGNNPSQALEVMQIHYEQICEHKTLLQDYILLSSRQGHYSEMESSMMTLEELHGSNGIHSKIMQSMYIARFSEERINDYILKMKEYYGKHSGYEVLRAAYNARSWDNAEKLANNIPPSPRNHLLALKTFHRNGNKSKTMEVFSKLRPRDLNPKQRLEVVRIGLKYGNEIDISPWVSGTDSALLRLEKSRSQFELGISENDFLMAMEAYVHLYEVEGTTHRQILQLLRTDASKVHEGLDRLFEIGGTDPKLLSYIIEFGEKFRYREISRKAFHRLDCMALCSHQNHNLIDVFLSGVVNSGNLELMRSAYNNIPYYSSSVPKLHQFASHFERVEHCIAADFGENEDNRSDLIEVNLLSQIIRNHADQADAYTPRSKHALVVNNTLKFGGAERQVVRCLKGNDFTKSFVLWNRRVNTDMNSFIGSVEKMKIQIFDLSVELFDDELPYEPDIEQLLSLIPSTPPFNPGIKTKVRNLVKIIKNDRPEALHLWQDTTNVLGAISGLIAGVPRIVMSARSLPPFASANSSFPDKGPNYYFNNRFVRDLYSLLLECENVYLCHNSEIGRQKYVEWLGGYEEKMPLLRNGFDFIEQLPTKPDKKGKHRIVGVVFRFVEVKRPLLWLEVAKCVFRELPDVRFKMVGDGPMLEMAMNYASSLGLSGVVEFLGYRDDVDSIMPTFDAFLLTSAIEGLPNVLVEAQGFGVPVVSTNAGGARETFLDGKTGILVKEEDVETLASSVITVLNEPSFARQARTIGREFVINTFSESVMHRKLESILFGVVS